MLKEENNQDYGQIDYPIMEKGRNNLCIFDTGDYYVLRKYKQGILLKFNKNNVADEFWTELIKAGWKKVKIEGTL